MNPFHILSLLSIEITEAQLLISGLASGAALVGAIFKWVIASPERESIAYRAGVADEGKRCEEDKAELKEQLGIQQQQVEKLRDALLKLAIAADLTMKQRREIAEALGLPVATIMGIGTVEGDDKGGNLGSIDK